jgi:hypothetical protein
MIKLFNQVPVSGVVVSNIKLSVLIKLFNQVPVSGVVVFITLNLQCDD